MAAVSWLAAPSTLFEIGLFGSPSASAMSLPLLPWSTDGSYVAPLNRYTPPTSRNGIVCCGSSANHNVFWSFVNDSSALPLRSAVSTDVNAIVWLVNDAPWNVNVTVLG